jgi:hypothetical protein
MLTAVYNMNHSVTMPRFAPSSLQQTAAPNTGDGNAISSSLTPSTSGWAADDDFDLLAAYLLDEGAGAPNGLAFDFG